MGVKDLTTFVNKHQQFFEDYELHSTELVIDGYWIMSKLYFYSDVDSGNHGGEFQKFYDHCAKFWQKLHYCGIKPYVVFDGAYDMDGKKDGTLKDRLQKKIDEVWKINQGEHASIMPTMANEVFKKVLRDFQVQFAFCDFEADKDIALVANAFGCPVLAEDSDFFIMDIEKGFIHFDKVIWSNQSSVQETQKVIKCEKYQLNKFCDYFQVESCLMPLFASVCGNDYLELLNLDNFFSATKQRNQCELDERSHPRHTCEGDTKFCEVLHHFTYYQTYQECLKMIVEHVPCSKRETTESALRASCKMYVFFNESPIIKFFKGKDADLSKNLLVSDHRIPGLFLKSLREGEVPMICLRIYLNRKYFLGAQVEKITETRSSYCSQDLLRVLAGIMLGAAAKEESETLKIEIYDREKKKGKRFKVEPLYQISGFPVPLFTSRNLTSKKEEKRAKCRQFLLACLEAKDMTMDGIPEQFQLVLVVTVYWLHHAQQEVPHNLLVALVLGWIQGVAWCLRKNTLYGLDERLNPIYPWPNHESVLDDFGYFAKEPQNSLNLDASHSLAQWLACICSAEDINALLMHVFPRADMTVFFNGLLIHNLYYTLPELREDHEEWIGKLLPRNSYGRNLYDSLMKFLLSNYEVEKRPIREDQWQDVQ